MKKLIGTATTLLLLGAITPIYQKDVDKSINYNASAQVGDALVNISLFGGSDHETIGSVVRTSDGGFIVTGSTKSNGTGDIPAHSAVTGTRIGFLAKYDAQKVRE